ncbi:ABC transporter substrate-binding protein [Schumannella luteola]|uniref:Peptide/nickel transport system substrate-binding protein n=1 Tax=Schumannella luteola TaxID=472059 RepID=A0A852YES6_9MICO|nr:ABC transporter substrate-binding protein [Schumannella luteola]NYG99804.1 peptide/nickel transport system substrate-binding protein [Schumannella luteola]TPX02258.1 peptide ABC transporter substrate-binding protein [Schumannella luteola]
MSSAFSSRRARILAAAAGTATLAVVLAGCAGGGGGSSDGDLLVVGTTDKLTTLDPAGSYDNGSYNVQTQVFPFLVNTAYGSPDVEPDISTSAEFTAPSEYTVKLKKDLKFANGNALTSSDVKFSFERIIKINDPNGPSSLLANLDSISTPDDTTVVFKLKSADQTFPQVLSSPAGPIVDEDTFSADKVTPDADVVKGEGFAGQYRIEKFSLNKQISFLPNKDYDGLLGKPKNAGILLNYYAQSSNMKLEVQKGEIDAATRSLTPTDVADLRKDSKLKVWDGPGGESRYITFNFRTQPFGTETPEADPAKALAVRQAFAASVDREALAKDVYKDTYTPAYSAVPEGLTGASTPFKDLYGKDGKPDVTQAAKFLSDAGVQAPVQIDLQYNPDHYGESSADEYAAIKSQLEETKLFTVNLKSTEWVTYSKERVNSYPVFQMGWFPDFSDADNYLSVFFLPGKDADGNPVGGGFLQNGYENDAITKAIQGEQTEQDKAKRTALIEEAQKIEAEDISILPLLTGKQVVVTSKDIKGVTLDASFKFRFAPLEK